MATPPAWRVKSEIRAPDTLVDATSYATADAGSIPAVSTSNRQQRGGVANGDSAAAYSEVMADQVEIEFVFEPQDEGGYYVYAPDLPGLHTQGDDLDDATENAREALALYIEGLREDGRSVDSGVVRRTLAVPA